MTDNNKHKGIMLFEKEVLNLGALNGIPELQAACYLTNYGTTNTEMCPSCPRKEQCDNINNKGERK